MCWFTYATHMEQRKVPAFQRPTICTRLLSG
jgi:hypothetical protein